MGGKGDGAAALFHRGRTKTRKQVLSQALHPDDKAKVARGEVSAATAKALRHRRSTNFANQIEGAVHSGRLSRCVIAAYAPPSLTTVPLTLLISVYVIQFYETMGASLGLLAFFQALARAFDVITDPTMSYVSDSNRSKFGRRRVFLASGAPFYGICLLMLLFPQPGLDKVGVSIWFAATPFLPFFACSLCFPCIFNCFLY
jgi:hypothetical protein